MDVDHGLNDFYLTTNRDVNTHNEAHNEAHRKDLARPNAGIGELEQRIDVEKIIILTHWSPSKDRRAIEPRHKGGSISSAFSTDLSSEPCFTNDEVKKAWAYGHTHNKYVFLPETQLRRTPLRLLANQ